MDLAKHYTTLYTEAAKAIMAGNCFIDKQIDSPLDKRSGITLRIRPDEQTKQGIQIFLNELRAVAPSQYYYPDTDIHITVMSIISCYPEFNLSGISVEDYIDIINRSIMGLHSFEISLHGITASASGVMVQGFPENDVLQDVRQNLRNNFKHSRLEQSIDKRYAIFTAHATVMRFRDTISSSIGFLQVLEKYRSYDFGAFKVKELELVYNDWYHRKQFVRLLHTFKLP